MRLNTILALTIVLLPLTTHAATTQPFILGADISWVPEDEADGATYFDHGVQKDIFQILHDNQFNMIRLRVFVHPHAPHGYAAGKAEAFCDLAHTLAMAKRAQAAGMGLLISLHYSDTWTNPEGHPKPHAWDGMTVEQLAGAVHDHTRDVLAALKDQGTPADMVAIGNEVTHGMLWPEGRVWSHIPSGNAQTDAANTNLGPGNGNYDNFATFLKAGIAAAREVDPNINVMLHHSLGRHKDRVMEWLDNLEQRGVRPDVIGLSCYSQRAEGDWDATFHAIIERYPDLKVAVAEYSARKRDINDLTFNLPDHKGIGTFIWEPTRHREALFDQNNQNAGGGQASNFLINGVTAVTRPSTAPAAGPPSHGGRYDTNELIQLYPEMARDYGNGKSHE